MEQHYMRVSDGGGTTYVASFGETPEISCMRVLGINEWYLECFRILKSLTIKQRHRVMKLAYEINEENLDLKTPILLIQSGDTYE